MVKNVTVEFEGTPYFLYETSEGVFGAVKFATCACDTANFQLPCYRFDRDLGGLILGKDLEEVPTNNISLLVKVPERGFISLELIEQCRNFAKTAKEVYVCARKCHFEYAGVIHEVQIRPLTCSESINGKVSMLFEVKPRLFRRI